MRTHGILKALYSGIFDRHDGVAGVVGGMGSSFGSECIGIEFGVVALALLIIRPSMLLEVRDRQLLSCLSMVGSAIVWH